jgi:hypothetical protein
LEKEKNGREKTILLVSHDALTGGLFAICPIFFASIWPDDGGAIEAMELVELVV